MKKLSPIDPADYVAVIGSTFAKREHAPVLAFGRHSWTRLDLGRLGVPHTVAASHLNRVCTELRITTIAGLAERASEIGLYRGCGTTTYWLVLAILRSHGYDVAAVHAEPVTFSTLKQRARKVLEKDRKRKRKPRRAGPPSDALSVH